MTKLLSPLTIKSVTLRNRIVVSPMCMYSSHDGFSNDWHLVHLGSRAVGGAGLIMTEATAVSPEGRISPEDLGIWKDEHIEGLKRITNFIEQQGAVAGIQLVHAGRKAGFLSPWKGDTPVPVAEGGWPTFAPSDVPFKEGYAKPLQLDQEGIEKVKGDFKMAAIRALKAGFKVAEIHAAHGYLLHEFLSPLSNFRTDHYGGSFENRIRLVLEVVESVQAVWPGELPLFVRISATDWVEGGWTLEDSVALSAKLKDLGADLIDCSGGGVVPNAKISTGPGYQVPFAAEVKRQTGILTAAVGLISGAGQAEEILESGKADLIFLAREHLRNPYFSLNAAHELGADVPWPVQYLRAKFRG